MLIQVSVLNQQYLIILMYVINIIQIFQAESIEAHLLWAWDNEIFLPCWIKIFDFFFKVNLFVPSCLPGGIWGKEEFPAEPYFRFSRVLEYCIDFINLQTRRVKLLFQLLVLHFCKNRKSGYSSVKDKTFLALQNRCLFKAAYRRYYYILCWIAF